MKNSRKCARNITYSGGDGRAEAGTDEAAKMTPIQRNGGNQSKSSLQRGRPLFGMAGLGFDFRDIGYHGMKTAIQPAINVKATNPRNILIPKIRRSLGVSRIRNENAKLISAASRVKMPQ